MQYRILRQQLKDFSVFLLSDIRKIEPNFYRPRLNEWQEKGYIKKLRRGHYLFTDVSLNEETLFFVANRLYAPSYVSFEAALSYYGLIPEGVYTITSACGKKTARFRTPIATFTYRHLKSQLLFGYTLQQWNGHRFKIAEIEKAVVDYLYLNPKIVQDTDFHEWRFNSKDFLAKADRTKLRAYAEAFRSKALLVRLEKLIKFIQHSV